MKNYLHSRVHWNQKKKTLISPQCWGVGHHLGTYDTPIPVENMEKYNLYNYKCFDNTKYQIPINKKGNNSNIATIVKWRPQLHPVQVVDGGWGEQLIARQPSGCSTAGGTHSASPAMSTPRREAPHAGHVVDDDDDDDDDSIAAQLGSTLLTLSAPSLINKGNQAVTQFMHVGV